MRSRVPLFALLFIAGFFALPLAAHAGGIPFLGPVIDPSWTVDTVTGGKTQCPLGWGAVITVINNVIRLLITLAIVFVAPIMIAYAGFLFVVNPVNASGKEKAKDVLKNTIVGIIIALAGWMIVDAIMAVLYHPSGSVTTTWSNLITSGGAPTCLPQQGVGTGLNQSINGAPGVTVVPSTTAPASEAAVRQQLASAGVQINHSVPCSPYNIDGVVNGCTNVGGMLSSTVAQVITLKNACGSGCSVMVTGGSEAGHASGTRSHGAGYKVDLGLDSALNNFLQKLPLTGQRGGDSGGPIRSDTCGNQYVQESNHWDITVLGTCSL